MNHVHLFSHSTADSLLYPPRRIGTKVVAALIVKLLNSMHQSKIAFLDEIDQENSCPRVATCKRNHKTQIRLDQLTSCQLIASSCSSCEIDFFLVGKQVQAANVLQVAFKRISCACCWSEDR